MKVLFLLRSDAKRVYGGDINYVESVAPHLSEAGLNVEVSDTHPPNLAGVDVLHIINVTNVDEADRALRAAQAAGIPVILSPEYVNLDRFFLHTHWKASLARRLMGERPALGLYRARKVRTDCWRKQAKVLSAADRIVAKSAREKEELGHDFHLAAGRITVIPNGVDPRFGTGASPARFTQRYKVKDFLLTVGRVEPIKNQRSLLLATRGLTIPLVFIGGGYTNTDRYLLECRRLSRGRPVTFIDRMPHEELAAAYAAARAHVAPSFAETTSLVSLEAVMAGCPAVLTTESPYEEYFGKGMITCDPYDLSSIRRSVETVLRNPRRATSLRNRLIERLSWTKIGRELAKTYREVAP